MIPVPGSVVRTRSGRAAASPAPPRARAAPHAPGLAVGRSNRAGIQMIAPDDDRGPDLPSADELVEDEAHPRPLPVAAPADPRRQALGLPAPAGRGAPTGQG